MKIDVKKLGYRWKGNHTATAAYERGDVVRMNGDVKYHDGGGFVTMASGQRDANIKGAVLTKTPGDVQVSGTADQILHVGSSNNPEFQFTDGRSSTSVRKMAKVMGGRYGGFAGRGGRQQMAAIMTDGSVRIWGSNQNSSSGTGLHSTNASLPDKVAFPSDAPEMSEVYITDTYTNFARDAEGGLWAWGYGGAYAFGTPGNTVNRGLPEKLNGRGNIPEDAKIVDFFCSQTNPNSYSTRYYIFWCRDDQGNVYGWGNNPYGLTGAESTSGNIEEPTLIPLSQRENIVDIQCFANRHYASYFITDTGKLYAVGDTSSTPWQSATAQDDSNSIPALWTPSTYDPVKKISVNYGRYNTTTSSFYQRYLIVTTNGKLYSWGATSNSAPLYNFPDYVNGSLAAYDNRIDDVKDAYVRMGYTGTQYVLKNDGTIWGIGYCQHINPVAGTNKSTYFTEWTDLGFGSDNEELWIQSNQQAGYSAYGSGVLTRKTDGTIHLTGYWFSTAGQGAGGPNPNTNNSQHFGAMRVKGAIDAWAILGGDSQNNIYVQIGGEVFSNGYGVVLGNDDDSENRQCLSQIIF